MVDVGSAAIVLFVIALIAGLHLRVWGSLGEIIVLIIVLRIIILVHVLRDRIEKLSQECPELLYTFARINAKCRSLTRVELLFDSHQRMIRKQGRGKTYLWWLTAELLQLWLTESRDAGQTQVCQLVQLVQEEVDGHDGDLVAVRQVDAFESSMTISK